jgi:Zn-dependent protease
MQSPLSVRLGAFNLVPAFPLDGGRVLRGALWNRSGNLLKATSLVSRMGEAFAYIMTLGGFLAIFLGDLFDGIWLLFLGWLLRSGAETSKNQTVVSEALAGLSVGDVMTNELITVAPDMMVQRLVSSIF